MCGYGHLGWGSEDTWVGVQRKAMDPLESVTGNCESHSSGSGSRTLLLLETSAHLTPEPSLQPPPL